MAFFGCLPDLTHYLRIDYWPVLEESFIVAITWCIYQARKNTEYVEDFLLFSYFIHENERERETDWDKKVFAIQKEGAL